MSDVQGVQIGHAAPKMPGLRAGPRAAKVAKRSIGESVMMKYLVVLVAFGGLSNARADDLKACMERTNALARRGDHAAACRQVLECDAMSRKDPEVLRHVAQHCGYSSGDCSAWQRHLERAIDACHGMNGCQQFEATVLRPQLERAQACPCDLHLDVEPADATVRVGGRTVSSESKSLSRGVYAFEISAAGHVTEERTIACDRLEPIALKVRLNRETTPPPPLPPPSKWPGWVLLGVGAGSTVAGGLLEWRAIDAAQDTNDLATDVRRGRKTRSEVLGEYADAKDRAESSQIGAWVGLGVGVALLATGAWLLTSDDGAPSAGQVQVGPGGVGVSF